MPLREPGPWNDGYLYQWIGMFAEPAYSGMTSLMDGNGTFLLGGHHLCLLLKSSDDTVNGIKEVLTRHFLFIMARRYQRSLIADIGDVSTREARSLTCQKVDIQTLIVLQRTEMDHEDSLSLREVRQVDMYHGGQNDRHASMPCRAYQHGWWPQGR